MRGVSVRVAGLPFYAGWGVTDDYLVCERRAKKCSIEDIFYAAYIKVPTYLVPQTGERSTFASAVHEIVKAKKERDQEI